MSWSQMLCASILLREAANLVHPEPATTYGADTVQGKAAAHLVDVAKSLLA